MNLQLQRCISAASQLPGRIGQAWGEAVGDPTPPSGWELHKRVALWLADPVLGNAAAEHPAAAAYPLFSSGQGSGAPLGLFAGQGLVGLLLGKMGHSPRPGECLGKGRWFAPVRALSAVPPLVLGQDGPAPYVLLSVATLQDQGPGQSERKNHNNKQSE